MKFNGEKLAHPTEWAQIYTLKQCLEIHGVSVNVFWERCLSTPDSQMAFALGRGGVEASKIAVPCQYCIHILRKREFGADAEKP